MKKWFRSLKNNWSTQKNNTVLDTGTFDPTESYEAFQSLINNFPEAVCLFDYKGDLVTTNKKWSELTGFSERDVPQHLNNVFRSFDFEQGAKGKSQTSDEMIIHQDGHRINVQIVHIPILMDEDVKGVVSIIKDTTETLKTQKSFTDNIIKMRDILNNLDIAIWAIDPQKQKVIFCSNAFKDIYGLGSENLKIDTWQSFIHPDDLDEVIKRQQKVYQGETLHHTYRIVTANDKIKWVRDHTIPVIDSTGKLVRLIGFVADMTETKMLQQKLQHTAYYDELTELPNRNLTRKTIQQWIVKHKQDNRAFALLYLNMDGLNRINDTVGHEIGDEAVRITANRIKSKIQESDVALRPGGDEFIILIEHHESLEDYQQAAQRLVDVTEPPIQIEGYDIYVTISIGISLFSIDSSDYTPLVRNARIAMNRAKRRGKDNYQIYGSHMNIASFKLFQLEGDLHKAAENQELFLEYQPRIDVKTQKAVGAEALIRWNHPVWGRVSPSEFIPLAEENSQINQNITQFVIEHTCKQIKSWQKDDVPFSFISLNLSANNFLKSNLVDIIKSYLDLYDIHPSMIEIEVTERSLLQADPVVESQLKQLKETGVRIALDDYGTGYSTIHYLKDHPIHTIKIDRSFIQDLIEKEEDQVIVRSTIDLGKGLKKNVVAEGVETREQYDLLKKFGCDEIQGYLFSKSVSGDEMGKIFLEELVYPKEQAAKPSVERRRYFRIDFPFSLSTQMTILSFGKKEVSLGSTEVLVQDMGLGGLRFMSHLRLKPDAYIIYGFQTVIMDTEVKLSGKIVWDREIKMDLFEYGVEYLIEEGDRDHLATLLNQLSLKLRSNQLFNDGDFITENALGYMKKHYLI